MKNKNIIILIAIIVLIVFLVPKKTTISMNIFSTSSECNTDRTNYCVPFFDRCSECSEVTLPEVNCWNDYGGGGPEPHVGDWVYVGCDEGDCDSGLFYKTGDDSETYYKCLISNEWTEVGCEETDSGKDYTVKGEVTYLGNGLMDYCINSNRLRESYCDASIIMNEFGQAGIGIEYVDCECVDGACTSSPSCNTNADVNCNDLVSDVELLSYANLWLSGTISDSELLQAASAWLGG